MKQVSATGPMVLLFASSVLLLLVAVPLCGAFDAAVLGLVPPAVFVLIGFKWLKTRTARLSARSTEPLELEFTWGEVRELSPAELGWVLGVGRKTLHFRALDVDSASLVKAFEARKRPVD